jgi:hypothetical protein
MTKNRTRVKLVARTRKDVVRQLPLTSFVTAQLANDAGGCWSTTYRDSRTNTSRRFRADAGCDDCSDR